MKEEGGSPGVWRCRALGCSEDIYKARRASGAMDNASDYGSEDCRFDSCLARTFFSSPLGAHVVLASFSRISSFLTAFARPAECCLSDPIPHSLAAALCI